MTSIAFRHSLCTLLQSSFHYMVIETGLPLKLPFQLCTVCMYCVSVLHVHYCKVVISYRACSMRLSDYYLSIYVHRSMHYIYT